HFLRIALGRGEHLADPLFRGRNDRQAVGPSFFFEERLRRPDVIGYLKTLRLECRRCHKCHPSIKLTSSSRSVIPAHAGIQLFYSCLPQGQIWIVVCTRMTKPGQEVKQNFWLRVSAPT